MDTRWQLGNKTKQTLIGPLQSRNDRRRGHARFTEQQARRALGVGDELVDGLALLVQLRLHGVRILLVALAPLERLLRQLIISLLHRQLCAPVPLVLCTDESSP